MGEAVAGVVARTCRASAMRLRVRGRGCACDLGPAHFEETAHPVAGFAHGTVVLVEHLAVDEHLPDIGAKLIARLVPASRSTRCEKNSGLPGGARERETRTGSLIRAVKVVFFSYFRYAMTCADVCAGGM